MLPNQIFLEIIQTCNYNSQKKILHFQCEVDDFDVLTGIHGGPRVLVRAEPVSLVHHKLFGGHLELVNAEIEGLVPHKPPGTGGHHIPVETELWDLIVDGDFVHKRSEKKIY